MVGAIITARMMPAIAWETVAYLVMVGTIITFKNNTSNCMRNNCLVSNDWYNNYWKNDASNCMRNNCIVSNGWHKNYCKNDASNCLRNICLLGNGWYNDYCKNDASNCMLIDKIVTWLIDMWYIHFTFNFSMSSIYWFYLF